MTTQFVPLPQVEFPNDVKSLFVNKIFGCTYFYLIFIFGLSVLHYFLPIIFVFNSYIMLSGSVVSLGVMYMFPTTCKYFLYSYLGCFGYFLAEMTPTTYLECATISLVIPSIIVNGYLYVFKNHQILFVVMWLFLMMSCLTLNTCSLFFYQDPNIPLIVGLDVGCALYISNLIYYTKQSLLMFTPTQYTEATRYIYLGPLHLIKSFTLKNNPGTIN